MSTRLELRNPDGHYVVEVLSEDLTMDDLVEGLIKPLLLAAGYHPRTVDDAFAGDEE